MSNELEGKPAGDSGDPQMVEVEVDGKKIIVSEEGKDYLLRQADYSKKTAAVAAKQKELDASRQELETARGFLNVLASDPDAAQLMEGLLSGDKEIVKKIASQKGGNEEDPTESLARKVEALEKQLSMQRAVGEDERRRQAEYADAKRIAKDKYGLNIDEYFPKMTEIASGSPEEKNRFVTLALRAAHDDLIKKAKAEGLEEGQKKALDEFILKADNTPTFSSGSGAGKKPEIAKTKDAGIEAFHDLLNKGAAR